MCWDMRSGKTSAACAIARARMKSVGVIAPTQVQKNWREELNKFGLQGPVTTPLKCPKEDFSGVQTLILDEIHLYRSNAKTVTQMIKNVGAIVSKVDYVIGLTGTLFDKDVSELFYIAKFIGNKKIVEIDKVTRWFGEYCHNVSRENNYSVYKMHQHLFPAFVEKMAPYIHTHKDNAKPPKARYEVYQLDPIQMSWGQKLKNGDLPLDWDVPAKGWALSTRNQKSLQIAGGFLMDNCKTHHLMPYWDCHKWKKVKKYLEDGIKTVYFYRFLTEKDILQKIANNSGKNLEDFKTYSNYPKKEVIHSIFGHPQNTGVGVDLREFDRIVYLSETPSAILAAQSAARLNVHGQDMSQKEIVYFISAEDYSKRLRQKHLTKKQSLQNFLDAVANAKQDLQVR